MIVDSADLDPTAAYKLLIGSVIPRPIAWVSTLSQTGVANLAPISFFTVVGRKPPMVSLSMQSRANGTLKDTFVNIRDTGEFVTNLVTLPHTDAMHGTAYDFAPGLDEFAEVKLEKEPSTSVRPPRVKNAPIAFECVLERIIPMGTDNDHVVFGEIRRFFLRDELYLDRGRLDTAALPVVGRLAGEYTLVENVFTTPLDDQILAGRRGRRMDRLDDRPSDWSPIGTDLWSPTGATPNQPATPDRPQSGPGPATGPR
ncbi:flavin reductase family protein [Rhodococcus opacus]|uniref:flavin reductase family protein n=1 Tax=Rhodococcus opacus TaxID=37919 RepID=UPI000ACCC078|nr:flavin reductase family protein [Rhodococcus opacus]